jgi:hypothetical protein
MTNPEFLAKLKAYLRISGYSQKMLAVELGLRFEVLNRKLSASGRGYLTRPEVKQIIVILAKWQAFNTTSQVVELLDLLDLPANFFTQNEWQTYPLNQLEIEKKASKPKPIPNPGLLKDETSPGFTLLCFEKFNNLPYQLTPLVGREWLLEKAAELLRNKNNKEESATADFGRYWRQW